MRAACGRPHKQTNFVCSLRKGIDIEVEKNNAILCVLCLVWHREENKSFHMSWLARMIIVVQCIDIIKEQRHVFESVWCIHYSCMQTNVTWEREQKKNKMIIKRMNSHFSVHYAAWPEMTHATFAFYDCLSFHSGLAVGFCAHSSNPYIYTPPITVW